ncbi:helix-turn-helix transcriptional regulator [Daejeonella sp.]|uniref:helix-turn-helix domain-containing protein n=1 Tax=Daejeonella sp. TaxID=2805397 RepID=UPI0030BB4EFA
MATVKEIYNYTPQEWEDHQAEILEHVVEGRKQLGLTREWIASNAGYSITQYTRLEEGIRFLEFEDFMRIGVVFYKYQESLSPAYIQAWNRLILIINRMGFHFRFWIKRLRDLFES